MDKTRLERHILEAAKTLEAWYWGNGDDRVVLRMLRAQLQPLVDQLLSEPCSVCQKPDQRRHCGGTGCPR